MNRTTTTLLLLILCVQSAQLYVNIKNNTGSNVPLAAAAKSQADEAMDKKITHLPPNLPPTSIAFALTSHDFGIIKDDKKVYTRFAFVNTGTEPLMIISAEGSCGCTVPDWPKRPIAPKDSSYIEVSFDPNGKSGEVTKVITITSNTNPSASILSIKANIVKSN
jgi:hypothetical protein